MYGITKVEVVELARHLDGAELVVFDEDRETLWTWNGSRTFNAYALDGTAVDHFEAECWDAEGARELVLEHVGGAPEIRARIS